MKTFMAKPHEVQRKWYVIDAAGKSLGRVAATAAALLRGKHKPIYTPHVDTGDHVIIINAEKVRLTGKKLEQKEYIRHSGYPGGLKRIKYGTLLKTQPEKAVHKAVWGMLPHNRLGRKIIKKLRVYRGDTHPHQAQKPEVWTARD
ncbi:MAG: 50S ribosomal protein L13 [Thermoanaerobacteraceae bacterium]|uniref:50S ribosomal protein L13 n=1 Tax=Thermanaeromonas sp. C210 TaxID=2731925 RepID=UPI00155CFD20|nr:50S ribosomal protein L13 [Thermanaeromonas sp. C210]MBE3580319.1 50S ribosomal protein L13 [Thermoanaerobacteraceae bacterium]GFN23013.1 50S ribosomal protein L13 [Thermanaeromonas sp. C210]